MRVLVIDVAAEHGGALSILNQHIQEFKKDLNNEYIVVLSSLYYDESNNVKFINIPWVKKSSVHRLYFDNVYIKKLGKRLKPDRILSLQNKAVAIHSVPQDVYFQNVLFVSDKKFSFFESRHLWCYQSIIGKMTRRSLKRADIVYVQAEWIKDVLISKWRIKPQSIVVKRPSCDKIFISNVEPSSSVRQFFYPASAQIYKNHIILLKAFQKIWNSDDPNNDINLILTCKKENLSRDCQNIIESGNYPVSFVGHLTKEEMVAQYLKSVLIFPSYIETVGLPLIEAKSLGVKILASDLMYAHEAIGEYDRVQYFQYDDCDDLVRKINDIISN